MVSQNLEDISMTVLIVCLILTLTETVRAGMDQFVPPRYYCLSMEAVFTFQMCLIMHELLLLSEAGQVGLLPVLIIMYFTTVVHHWHAASSACNFPVAIQEILRGRSTFVHIFQRIFAQVTGSFLAWDVAYHVHAMGLTRLHSVAPSECTSRLRASRAIGFCVEMGGYLAFSTMQKLMRHTSSENHVHIVSITFVTLQAAGVIGRIAVSLIFAFGVVKTRAWEIFKSISICIILQRWGSSVTGIKRNPQCLHFTANLPKDEEAGAFLYKVSYMAHWIKSHCGQLGGAQVQIATVLHIVGEITGAFFNPALAFSINFFCKGSSLLDNIFVYWLGPIAGMILSVIIFDQLIPTLRRMARREEKID